MRVTTVNISFQRDLLSEIDEIARNESRSRSELLREAARAYIARKKRWDKIFEYGNAVATRARLTEADVVAETQTHRKQKAKR